MLVFVDSFEGWSGTGAATGVKKGWTFADTNTALRENISSFGSTSNPPPPIGARTGDRALYMKSRADNFGQDSARFRVTFDDFDTMIVGFGWMVDDEENRSGIHNMASINFGNNTIIFLAQWNQDTSKVSFSMSGFSDEIAPGVYDGQTWIYVEMKVFVHPVNGYAEARIEGETVATFSGNTDIAGTGVADSFIVHSGNNNAPIQSLGGAFWFDDVIVMNGEGSQNNDFVGPVSIVASVPNGIGSVVEWEPVPGVDNYLNVDELPNDDADYVFSLGEVSDLHEMQDVNASSILGIQTCIRGKKNIGKGKQFKNLLQPVSTIYDNGAAHIVGITHVWKLDIFETNPETSQPWTGDEYDATRAGYKVVEP
jgi:hypothetical protein